MNYKKKAPKKKPEKEGRKGKETKQHSNKFNGTGSSGGRGPERLRP